MVISDALKSSALASGADRNDPGKMSASVTS